MTWLDYWKTICCFWVLFLCFVWMDKSYVQPLSEALPFSVLMMQCELVGFLFWLLRTAIICILVWVLGAVTSKCFGVFFPWPWMVLSHEVLISYSAYSRVSLCRSLHFSLSPAFYSVLVSLVSSSHLDFFGLPAPFPPLGEPTGSACVPSPWSTAWRLFKAVSWAHVWLVLFVSCLQGSLSFIACLKSSVLLFHTFC